MAAVLVAAGECLASRRACSRRGASGGSAAALRARPAPDRPTKPLSRPPSWIARPYDGQSRTVTKIRPRSRSRRGPPPLYRCRLARPHTRRDARLQQRLAQLRSQCHLVLGSAGHYRAQRLQQLWRAPGSRAGPRRRSRSRPPAPARSGRRRRGCAVRGSAPGASRRPRAGRGPASAGRTPRRARARARARAVTRPARGRWRRAPAPPGRRPRGAARGPGCPRAHRRPGPAPGGRARRQRPRPAGLGA